MLSVGIDEAGRGPLAGPVSAAAVILPEDFDIPMLNDSKKISEKKRELARTLIFEQALFWHVGWASVKEIDEINILQASFLAMSRAFNGVQKKMAKTAFANEKLSIIVDGNKLPSFSGHNFELRCEPRADGKYPEVMAASILAKTARDHLMCRYALRYPEYGYERHKGYPTAAHVDAIHRFGNSPIQRLSFSVPQKRK